MGCVGHLCDVSQNAAHCLNFLSGVKLTNPNEPVCISYVPTTNVHLSFELVLSKNVENT